MATEPFVLSGLARFQVFGFFGSMIWLGWLGSKAGHFSVAFCAALLGLDGREIRVGLGSKDGHFSVAFCDALLGLDGRGRRVLLGSKYWDLLEVKVLMCSLLYCKACIWGIPLVQNEY